MRIEEKLRKEGEKKKERWSQRNLLDVLDGNAKGTQEHLGLADGEGVMISDWSEKEELPQSKPSVKEMTILCNLKEREKMSEMIESQKRKREKEKKRKRKRRKRMKERKREREREEEG
jgi:hypothetical protein